MKWIKANLLLVVSGTVALALLAFAGYFLWTKIEQRNGVTEQLTAATADLERLLNRQVHPSEENIKAAKTEQKRLADTLEQTKSYFPSGLGTNALEGAAFKAFMETSLHEITVQAEKVGMTLPPKPVNYSFTAQRPLVNFASGSIDPLTIQILDIKSIMNCLSKAKVHSLVSVRRASVSSDDPMGSTDYVTKKMATNTVTGVIISPYEVTFQCFSTELADALNFLAKAPETFVITNVVVAPGGSTDATASTDGSNPGAGGLSRYGGMDPGLAARYGMGGRGMSAGMMSRYGLNPGGAAAPPATSEPSAPQPNTSPTPTSGPKTVIDEKTIKVTLTIHSMRIVPPRAGEKSERKTPRAPAADPAATETATQ